eukprot:scaffold98084_cov36-Attheya_sp.AAC.3
MARIIASHATLEEPGRIMPTEILAVFFLDSTKDRNALLELVDDTHSSSRVFSLLHEWRSDETTDSRHSLSDERSILYVI